MFAADNRLRQLATSHLAQVQKIKQCCPIALVAIALLTLSGSVEVIIPACAETPAAAAQRQSQLAAVRRDIQVRNGELSINYAAQQQPGITADQLARHQARAAELRTELAMLRTQEQALISPK